MVESRRFLLLIFAALAGEALAGAASGQESGSGVPVVQERGEAPRAADPNPSRPFDIQGSREGILRAAVAGPLFRPAELFQGFEDYHHPRLKRLRDEYGLDTVVEGETDDFRRVLKLRHWVHTRWPIDNGQGFSGDAFAILEKAKTGAGFHCAHSMTVLQAALSAMGYVARNLGVDRDHRDLGRSAHHGVNEVWSNDHAKWVLLDAKYDIHFERGGVPLSALDLHDGVRADGGKGVVKVQGIDRREVRDDPDRSPEGTVRSYWWVSYHVRQDPFTHPHWSGGGRLVVYDNAAFREGTWIRSRGSELVPHWAYAAGAFIRTPRRHEIEWTPGVPHLRVRRHAADELEVEVRSATPNFEAYEVRLDGGPARDVADGRVRWRLQAGENVLRVRSRNLFGVRGPEVTASVSFKP